MCPQGDIEEDNGQQIISPFGQVLCFLNILCTYTPCNKLTNCYINAKHAKQHSLSNEYHCHKAGSSRNKTGFGVMCNIITVLVAFIECKRVNSYFLGHDSLQLVLINHLIITEISINFFRG